MPLEILGLVDLTPINAIAGSLQLSLLRLSSQGDVFFLWKKEMMVNRERSGEIPILLTGDHSSLTPIKSISKYGPLYR